MKFVIEHLEPELYEWCLIEYGHVSKLIGKGNFILTNIKNKSDFKKLKRFGNVYDKGVADLNFNKVCVLSQYSKKTLTASDKDKFQYLIFGGILGDNPAKKRTQNLINKLKNSKIKFATRNLGSRQMPTDVAVFAAKKILEGKPLKKLRFVDEVEVEINENESAILPFRFILDNNKVIISEKLVDYLRNLKGF